MNYDHRWNRPPMDASERFKRHGRVQPMEQQNWIERLIERIFG